MNPFYNNRQNSVNPFVPIFMPQNSFGNQQKEITPRNPLGDLSWLTRK
jgi:hypothetical protein